MKKFNLKHMAMNNNGEYIFGSEDTGSHACYMIYGILKPGEKGRKITPGKGHEELLVAASGSLNLTGCAEMKLEEGSAIHIEGEQTCFIENSGASEAVYIISGGHSGQGHQH